MIRKWAALSVCGISAVVGMGVGACSGSFQDVGSLNAAGAGNIGNNGNAAGAYGNPAAGASMGDFNGATAGASMGDFNGATAGASMGDPTHGATAGAPAMGDPTTGAMGGAPAVMGSTPCNAAPDPSVSAGASMISIGGGPPCGADIGGTWTGIVENYAFTDDSNAIVLDIDASGVGTAVFGASPTPAPASDAEAAYPPGVPYVTTVALSDLYPGFAFTVKNASYDGSRMQFDVDPLEVYRSWCELQPSYGTAPDHYGCLPNWESTTDGMTCYQTNPTTNEHVTHSCPQIGLCVYMPNTCSCTAAGCENGEGTSTHFELAVTLSTFRNRSSLDGSVVLSNGATESVHLIR